MVLKCLSSLAAIIGLMGGFTLSKQAVAKRITDYLVNFLKALLAHSLSFSLQFKSEPIYKNLASKFTRILLHDSTSIQVDSKLVEHFPGCKNQSQKPIAILKIQAIYDLLSETFCKFNLSSFTRNDQRASSDIIDILKPGDLVIRDLGYFDLRNFKTIHSKNAYFINRLKFGTAIFKSDSKTRLNLLDELTRYGELDIDIV
jgi:DNA-binding transcriptional regulator/RsmH inhibitor MraZ